MITTRAKFEHDQKHYFKNLFEKYGEIPSNHLTAIRLRQAFFDNYVLDRVIRV